MPHTTGKIMENNTSAEQDKELLSRLNDGDKGAFNVIFHKYYNPLTAYAYRFVELADAEEIVQDILLWLWENRETFIIQTSLASYLFRAVHHRCLSRIEKKSVKQRIETLYWKNQLNDIPSNTDEFQVEELLARIHQAIEQLPPTCREAFILHRFKNDSYKEIAQQLNVSTKTVDYRIQQAMKLLRADLKNYFPLLLLLIAR